MKMMAQFKSSDKFWLEERCSLIREVKEELKSTNIYYLFELHILNEFLTLGRSIEPFRWILVGWQHLFRRFLEQKLNSVNAYYSFEIHVLMNMLTKDGPIEIFKKNLVRWQQIFWKVGGRRAQKCQCLLSEWSFGSRAVNWTLQMNFGWLTVVF